MPISENFENIWREKFSPELIEIPRSLYRNYIPAVNISFFPVFNLDVISQDLSFKKEILKSVKIIRSYCRLFQPFSILPNLVDIIHQLRGLLSRNQPYLLIIRNKKVIKNVPINEMVHKECEKIQNILLERLLLFEDIQKSEVDKSTHTYFSNGKLNSLVKLIKNEKYKSILVFVRYISTCEKVNEFLVAEGINSTYVHGKVESSFRTKRINDFRKKILT